MPNARITNYTPTSKVSSITPYVRSSSRLQTGRSDTKFLAGSSIGILLAITRGAQQVISPTPRDVITPTVRIDSI